MFTSTTNSNCKELSDKSKDIQETVANTTKELLLKFLVLGDFGVGKTSIIRRYCEGIFSQSYKITIGADFSMKCLRWDDNTKVNLQLWDIAGHERFGYLTRVYYKYAVAAIIVFDLSRMETLASVEKWLVDLREKVILPNGDPIPAILLANKADVNFYTKIPNEDIDKLCEKYSLVAWYITSAKENTNISEALNNLISVAIENQQEYINNDTINLEDEDQRLSSNSSGCCY